ncbi:SDR family oxidoreductase [Telmatospirillum sp.]|uniref:SDR family oxidoreductase n=1 Tax=Telmatospirillum sp. TaxID=2079197 RepID=UPI0028430068|nr:SDR family oxidoreductase [Telmatospirillum sp.]MDR3437235.1 SDR family oxidoreductase [Telmatospirillum sp.]
MKGISMRPTTSRDTAGTVLLVGASRGLGLAMAAEFLKKGWNVVGTVRGSARTGLHDLADEHAGRVEIGALDITEPDQIAALHDRLSGRSFDILFVNAGTANRNQDETIADVSTDEFVRVMITNALGPMRVVEGLQDLVSANGLIGVMSSGQGSISNNEKGGHEVYRGSKAALNQYMRSYAARHAGESRALVLMAPGWIRTELGGMNAPFTVEESVPKIVDVLVSQQEKSGLQYLDREGRTVPW